MTNPIERPLSKHQTSYKVLSCSSPDELSQKVNGHIRDGWVVTGGIAIKPAGTASPIRYCQAMIKTV